MIEIKGLSKVFGNKIALSNISINFKKGGLHGLVGINGSGKSTLLKSICGVFKGDAGEILINSKPVYDNVDVKQTIAYIEDENDFFNSYRLKDIIKFYKLTYPNFSDEMFKTLNNLFKIPLNSRIRSLSKGQKMRVSIMMGLSIKPDVLILDEPTNGLDPIIRKEFLRVLADYVYENNATAVIASHNLTELERMCDSITLLDNGELKYSLSLDDLKQKMRKIQVIFKGEVEINHPSIVNIEKIGRVYYIVTNNYDKSIVKYIELLGAEFIEEVNMSLEDMFIYTVGGEYSELV